MLQNSKLTLFIYCTVVTFVMTSCNDTKQETNGQDVSNEEVLQHNIEEAKSLFYSLPSPIETASLLQKTGAEYDATVLNPVVNVNKYELASTKAINLGIYGSDLSYASVFDQTQEVMFYLSSCKKLADGLGISNAFDAETMARIEENINDKDSILHLISDTYWMADAYLEENERSNLSALIISGGWVEGLYIATQLAKSNPNPELIDRIAEQKLSLTHLLAIIETYRDEHGDVNDVFIELKEVETLFSQMNIDNKKTETKVNETTGITTIGGKNKLILEGELLVRITNKIEQIRNRFIQ